MDALGEMGEGERGERRKGHREKKEIDKGSEDERRLMNNRLQPFHNPFKTIIR